MLEPLSPPALQRGPTAYHSEFIGGGVVLKQDVDDMRVALLSCLVQGCVSILQKEEWRNDMHWLP